MFAAEIGAVWRLESPLWIECCLVMKIIVNMKT